MGVLGRFTGDKSEFYVDNCARFNTGVRYKESIVEELDSLVGTKWTVRKNCYSTFEPMFGQIKPLIKYK